MEPYRPYVDEIVFSLYQNDYRELDTKAKVDLINVIYTDVIIDDNTHPLNIAIGITCTSILKMLAGKCKTLRLPKFQ